MLMITTHARVRRLHRGPPLAPGSEGDTLMRSAPPVAMLLSMLLPLVACADSKPVPANPDEVEAAIKQANEAAANIERNEATEDVLDGR